MAVVDRRQAGGWNRMVRAPHFQYHATGILHVQMQDGEEFEVGPGAVTYLPSGHDAWVVGDEVVTLIDWTGRNTTRNADSPPGSPSREPWLFAIVRACARGV